MRFVVRALGATPLETYERHLHREAATPPDALEPLDVAIAVRAAAVGWVDLLMASGQYQHRPEPPYTPGLEFAGEVVGVGDAVRAWRVGDRVIADGLETGPRSLGAYRRYGGFASYAVAPERGLFRLPADWSFDEGACLLGGAETAWHALVHRARVQPGESVLVLGASGSTGLATVQVAKRLGATVIGVGRSAAKLHAARACGADHVVALEDSGATLKERVRALTDGRGADVVTDAVGGPLSTDALRAAAFGARFVVVGWSATPFAARGGRDPNVLPTNLILMKRLDVLGSPAAIEAHRDPTIRARRVAEVLAWAEEGHLRPHIGATYALEDLPAALRAKWSGDHAGNVVVRSA